VEKACLKTPLSGFIIFIDIFQFMPTSSKLISTVVYCCLHDCLSHVEGGEKGEEQEWVNMLNCPLLTKHIVNESSTYPGSTVGVSCPAGQWFKVSRSSDMTTVCSVSGRWTPAVPDCVGKC